MRFFSKITFDEIVYWSTLLYVSSIVCFLLTVLINTSTLETLAMYSSEFNMRKQSYHAVPETIGGIGGVDAMSNISAGEKSISVTPVNLKAIHIE